MLDPDWDWIVVGAGSAGCTIAARLSEPAGQRVLLLEAGPSARPLGARIPAAFNTLFRGRFDWAYETEPEARLAGRRLFWPRGKLLGGSSAMNAMIWTRGHAADFDGWEAGGCDGWGWNAVRPWFDRSAVRPSATQRPNPVCQAFIDSLEGLGIPRNDGFHDGHTDGAGYFDVSVHDGERDSTARAYLDPARRRPNLTIKSQAQVARIQIDRDRAAAVELVTSATSTEQVAARRGIILAAGAIGSPEILLRSGIGPSADLKALGIDCVLDRPAVGANLSDHLATGVVHHCLCPVTLEGARGLLPLVRWLAFKSGPLTSNIAEAGAFLRVDSSAPTPDLELLTGPVWFVEHGFRKFPGHGFTVAAIGLRPYSRGWVRLKTRLPADRPLVQANYLDDERDLDVLVAGIKWIRTVVDARPYDPYRGDEVLPGRTAISDDAIIEHIRREAQTLYHPAGTCRMGSDPEAVVDPSLRVCGVDRLWVADASVMPALVSAHPNAAVVMIGEKMVGEALSAGY